MRFTYNPNTIRKLRMDAPFPDTMMPDIEHFFKHIDPKLESGRNLYEEVFETGHFFPLQRRHELEKMIALARTRNPRVIMEIGTCNGGSLYHWCKCLSPKRAIAIEIRGTPYRSLFEKAFPNIQFLWIEDSSYSEETIDIVQNWLRNDCIDVLFIDGDKCFFKKDFESYEFDLDHNNGLVFFHDIVDDLPMQQSFKEVASLFPTNQSTTIIDFTDGVQAQSEVLSGYKPKNSYWQFQQHWKCTSMGVGVISLGKDL
jgi:predicted O-methyltransferase YrrM